MPNDPIVNLLIVIAVPLMFVLWLAHREDQKDYERKLAEHKAMKRRIRDSITAR